jgi:hypothetical protein
MAKRGRWAGSTSSRGTDRADAIREREGQERSSEETQNRLADFAEDLGTLLGTAQAKATTWLDQRKAIVGKRRQLSAETRRKMAEANQCSHLVSQFGGAERAVTGRAILDPG